MENGGGSAGALVGIIYLGIIVLCIAGMWKTFAKAGQPGWAAIVPIYNMVVLLQIAGKPIWWIVLMMIPFVNFVVLILACIEFAKVFGKSGGFAIGLAFLPFVFFPILGFGEARYRALPAAV